MGWQMSQDRKGLCAETLRQLVTKFSFATKSLSFPPYSDVISTTLCGGRGSHDSRGIDIGLLGFTAVIDNLGYSQVIVP